MMKLGFLASAAIVAFAAAVPAFADEEIGTVYEREFRGAEGTRTSGETRDLRWSRPVYSEETVRTDANEYTELEFVDGTQLTIGENSEVVLDSFVYDPATGSGDAVISFGKGVFRFVSGDMNKEGFALNTPSATLAIRGTIFRLVIDAVNNVRLYVEEGVVLIYPCNNEEDMVKAGEYALMPGNCGHHWVRNWTPTIDPQDGPRRDTDRSDSEDSDGPNDDNNDNF